MQFDTLNINLYKLNAMETKLFFLFFLSLFALNAQTTYDLDWFAGIGSNVDLTINSGDTVRWTWTSPNHTVENDPAGSSVEVFDSGFLGPTGSVFSHTFTAVGTNDYYCDIHGAGSMSGTITVQTLSIDDFALKGFSIYPNPAKDELKLELPNGLDKASIDIYDMLGKRVYTAELTNKPINISNWSKGVYVVRVTSENIVQTKKFIKQ